MKKADVIREVESLTGFKWQVAKSIVKLSEKPPGTIQKIGPARAGARSPMTQENAAKIVLAARERIALVDEGD